MSRLIRTLTVLTAATVCLSLVSCKRLFRKKYGTYDGGSAAYDPYATPTATETGTGFAGSISTISNLPYTSIPPAGGGLYKLSLSYTAVNALITVRYSLDYKAQTVGKSVIQVSRDLAKGEDEDLTWIPIPDPISFDLDEFTRVLVGAEIPELNGYTEVSRKKSTCYGVPGYEIWATWVPPNAVPYKRWSCTFLKSGHGYSFAYDLPAHLESTNESRLKAIINSTSFK